MIFTSNKDTDQSINALYADLNSSARLLRIRPFTILSSKFLQI